MSQVDELVNRLSDAIAVSVKKAMSEQSQPTVEDRIEELSSAVAELAQKFDGSTNASTETTVKASDILTAMTSFKDGQDNITKAVEALIDRVERVEKGTASSKAPAGQDGGTTETKKATGSAIDQTLARLGMAARNGHSGGVTLN